MWVRWANLQSSNVKFLQDSVCQKWLKSVHFWRRYSKNKIAIIFLGHSVELAVYSKGSLYVLRCSVAMVHGSRLSMRHLRWDRRVTSTVSACLDTAEMLAMQFVHQIQYMPIPTEWSLPVRIRITIGIQDIVRKVHLAGGITDAQDHTSPSTPMAVGINLMSSIAACWWKWTRPDRSWVGRLKCRSGKCRRTCYKKWRLCLFVYLFLLFIYLFISVCMYVCVCVGVCMCVCVYLFIY